MKRFIPVLIVCMALSMAADSKLPIMKLKDLYKKDVVTTEFYKDGPVLINFWSLSCEPCKKEMKHLDEFQKKFSDTGFEIVSINIDSPRSMSKVKSYVKSQKYHFQVYSDGKSELFRKTGGKVMPYTLLVNSKGEIISRRMGYNVGDEIALEKDIIAMMKAEAADVPVEAKPAEEKTEITD